MQVFDDEQHGTLAGSLFEKACQGRREAAFLLCGIGLRSRKRTRKVRCQFWQQPSKFQHDWVRSVWSWHSRHTQQVEQRRIRVRAIYLKATALEQKKAKSRGFGFCFGNQARFANTCLATHEGNTPLSAPGSINEPKECIAFGYAANKDRTHDWC